MIKIKMASMITNTLMKIRLYRKTIDDICIGWKVLFATIPPSNMTKGLPCFIVALAYIGVITMFVGEVATILGCAIGLKASVTAITLVALGTSLPDTFASKTAAQ